MDFDFPLTLSSKMSMSMPMSIFQISKSQCQCQCQFSRDSQNQCQCQCQYLQKSQCQWVFQYYCSCLIMTHLILCFVPVKQAWRTHLLNCNINLILVLSIHYHSFCHDVLSSQIFSAIGRNEWLSYSNLFFSWYIPDNHTVAGHICLSLSTYM